MKYPVINHKNGIHNNSINSIEKMDSIIDFQFDFLEKIFTRNRKYTEKPVQIQINNIAYNKKFNTEKSVNFCISKG